MDRKQAYYRALEKFSECQDNMSFHVQKCLDISNDWLDIPSKKEARKKEGKKIGRKNRKEKKSWEKVFRQKKKKEVLCWD